MSIRHLRNGLFLFTYTYVSLHGTSRGLACIDDGYIGAIYCYYSSTLGCTVAISRKRPCVLCRIVEKIFYFFYFLCHETPTKIVLYVESANEMKINLSILVKLL